MTTQRYLWANKYDSKVEKVAVQNTDGSLATVYDGYDSAVENPFAWDKPLVYFWVDPGQYWVTVQPKKGERQQTFADVAPEPLETVNFRDDKPLCVRQSVEGSKARVWDDFVINESAYGKLTIPEGSTVLDIGAHIGVFARDAVRRGAGHVVSYEPEPRNLDVLRRNADGFPITVIDAAVTSNTDAQTMDFWVNWHGGSALHSLHAKGGKVPWPVRLVDYGRHADYYKPDVVKCDIEGGEYFIDWHATPDSVKHVAMEIHLSQHQWRNEFFPKLVTDFETLGFVAVKEPKSSQRSTIAVWSR